jgi:hypothetical protein
LENVDRTHFVVLTGHLDDRPLTDLIRTLRVQRKSGRLQVEYPDAPGAFFFEDGQLVDAQLGNLRGVEALYAALSLRGASFNFNPLVRPPERSIDAQGQKFIWDLVESPRREGLSEIRVAGGEMRAPLSSSPELRAATAALPPAPQNALVRLEPAAAAQLTAPLEARLAAVESAIANTSRRFSRERLVYAVVISFLVGLTVVTALQALFGPFLAGRAAANEATRTQTLQPDAANSVTNAKNGDAARETLTTTPPTTKERANVNPVEPEHDASVQTADATGRDKPVVRQSQTLAPTVAAARGARRSVNSSASGGYVVNVLMEVKGGRVTEARVLNPRAGAGAYEALALRMARQRHYPDSFTGGDTLKIRVKP